MLPNAYNLTKIGFDKAENEPAKNLQKFANVCQFCYSSPLWKKKKKEATARRARPRAGAAGPPSEGRPRGRPGRTLVEKFDIEPFSDFSAK